MRGVDANQLQQLARCDLSERVVSLSDFGEMCRRAGQGRYSAVPPAGWPAAARTTLSAICSVAVILMVAGLVNRLGSFAGLTFLPDWLANAGVSLLLIAFVALLPVTIAGLIEADATIERSVARLLRGQCPVCTYQVGEQRSDADLRASLVTCPECGSAAVVGARSDAGQAA